jgi:hypothetical protein
MKNITAALIKAKSQFKPVSKNKVNPFHKSKYANLDSILEAIGDALYFNGLLLIQPIESLENNSTLFTRLIHAESGEIIESSIVIPSQSDPQKFGSLLTYYRRFAICSLLAIVADDDDDGNAAKPSESNNVVKKEVAPSPVPKPAPKASESNTNLDVEARAIAERKKAAVECFKLLNWDANQQKEWARKHKNVPSDEWSVSDWTDALSVLRLEISKVNNAIATL